MSVKVNKRVYSNLFTKPNEAVVPDWLIGNTGDWITATFDLEVGIDFLASMQQPLLINFGQRTIKLMNGKRWGEYGFDMGTTIKMSYTRTLIPSGTLTTELFDVVVENIMRDTLVYEENPFIFAIGYETIPTERSTEKITNVILYHDRDLQGLKVKYSNIENADAQSHVLNSFIDGTTTEMLYSGLDSVSDESFRDMELIGLQSGMSIDSARIRKVLSTFDNEEDWLITNSSQQVVLSAYQSFIRKSVQMQYVGTTGLPFQSSSILTVGTSGVADNMFINNSDFSGIRNFHIKINTLITKRIQMSPTGFSLYLAKFLDGTSYNYAGMVLLKDYNPVVGSVLSYDDVVTFNITAGDSYALVYDFHRDYPRYAADLVEYLTQSASAKLVNIVTDESYKKNYKLQLRFMLSSIFENRDDLINRMAPSTILNNNSLTDIIDIAFMPEWNNPNIITKNDLTETERLGNTGWFNENYNGLTNDFIVTDFRYENLAGQTVPSVSYGSDTKVKVKVANVKNLVVDQTNIHLGFSWIPKDEINYKGKLTGFHKNTKTVSPSDISFYLGNNYPYTYDGFSNDLAKINLKDIIVSQIGDELSVVFTLNPNSDFLQFFENKTNDRTFVLWLSVGDSTLDVNLSDRVSLLLDVNNMENLIVISGELDGVINKFLEHPKKHDMPGVDLYDGFIEDDVLSVSNFVIPKGQFLKAVSFGYEVENITTGAIYTLERLAVSTSGFPIVNDIPEIDVNLSRNFLLPFDNNKNWVKIVRDSNGDTSEANAYTSYFGSKLRWEDWLQRQSVPTEFFDTTKENNGFNNSWLDYLRNGTNHRINYFMFYDIEINGVMKRFKNSFNVTFNGYDENTSVTTLHEYYDNETNVLLNIGTDPETGRPLGVFLSNKKTRIEITYTNEVEDFDITNVYCATTCEIFRGAGEMQHHQISSIWEHNQGGILIPVEGLTKLKVEQIAPNQIKTSCLVDNEVLEKVPMYKITGRIGCFQNNDGIFLPYRIYDELNYEPNYQ